MKLAKTIIFIAFAIFQTAALGFSTLEEVYRLYKKQGIPFREDPYLENKKLYDSYDFIVIGAGPGGASVTNRLTEIDHWDVLLLEAGKDESIYTDVPALVSYLHFTDYNWGYSAEKRDDMCLAIENQRCIWPRGKGMGGSSITNYMIYTRGNEKDFDDYAKAGNIGWSYDEILPYFLKSENTSIPEYKNSPIHSTKGPLNVNRAPYRTLLSDSFLEAGKELGLPEIDYTDRTQIGVSRVQSTLVESRRCSAAKAYIKPIKNRPNLHVSIESRVTKILIDPSTKKAIGVEFVKNRKRRVIMARKEVILSAGGLNSPQLLMLSGIGPKEHLEELGIPVLQDLRVGENLQEHWTFPGLVFLLNETGIVWREKQVQNNISMFLDWFVNHKGPLALAGGIEGLGYLKTKYNEETSDYPDVELIFAAGSVLSGDTVRKSCGMTDEFFNEVYGPVVGRDSWTIFPMPLHPKSLGKIRLKDKNPWHWPLLFHDYFQVEEDAKVMIEGIKAAIRFAETGAFKKYGSEVYELPIPGCTQHPFRSDEFWRCALKYLIFTLHHQSGTCKMGPESDPTAVVSPQLKVHGIDRLRVVDGSVLPKIPTAHTYAPSLMIGEKAADMIKETWKDDIVKTAQPTTTDQATTDQTTESIQDNLLNSDS